MCQDAVTPSQQQPWRRFPRPLLITQHASLIECEAPVSYPTLQACQISN